jgi:signal recognition particle subunit SRP68
MNTEPRKKFHMVNRLRIAAKVAEALERLVMASERCDARTKLEAQAYHLWLVGTLGFETQQWKAAAVAFSKAKTIYERLSASMSEDEAAIYKQRLAEIAPSLRFCAYNLGSAGVEDVAASAGAGAGQDLVGMLLAQAKDDQAATLQEVIFRQRPILRHA